MKTYLNLMTEIFSRYYDQSRDVWSKDLGLRRSVDILHDHLTKPSLVLDIGCGSGIDSLALLKKGHSVYGLDLVKHSNWDHISHVHGERASFKAGDFQSLHLPLESFDAVLDNGCFHHQPPDEQPSYLNKIWTLLRPRGLLCLNVYSPNDPSREGVSMKMADGRHATAYRLDQLKATLADFRILYSERVVSSTHGGTYLIALAEKT